MIVVLDVLGAPNRGGGMNLYARELIKAWLESFPDDRLVVVGADWIRELAADHVNFEPVVIRRSGIVTRFAMQAFGSGLIARSRDADALLSVSPIVSFLFPRSQRACVVHDWRHVRNRSEFGLAQRIYRRTWGVSVRRAGGVICISNKTRDETSGLFPKAKCYVIPNGRDHARGWIRIPRKPSDVFEVLTFGHFVNKRASLVVAAVQLLEPSLPVRLTVVGAVGQERREMRTQLSPRARQTIEFPGFVEDDTYRALVQNSDVIVLFSSDEGFGLPVVEAEYFGIPCVVADDSGLSSIHGEAVIESHPTPQALATTLARIREGNHTDTPPQRVWTWRDCARAVRSVLIPAGSSSDPARVP